MPDSKDIKSPDELVPAIHGKVSGVSRIGRRAIALIALVGLGLIMLIIYGISQTGSTQAPVAVLPSAPPNQPKDITTEHFGADEPIALPTSTATERPPDLTSPAPQPAEAATTEPVAATSEPVAAPVVVPEVAATSVAQARRDAAEAARSASLAARVVREQAARDAAADQLALSKKAPIVLGDAAAQASTGAAGTANAAPAATAETGGGSSSALTSSPAGTATAGGTSSGTNFLNGPTGQLANGAAQKPVVTDRIEPTTPYEIVAGSVIPAIMITAVNSENPGLLTAQVREDVYDSLTGRSLLVPRGSRLIGVYKNEIGKGQTRILVAWKRLIFPDTSAIDLVDMSGADVEGSAGFEGRVDTHFGQLLSQALLASVITAGFQLSQPQQQTAGNGNVVVITPGQQAASAVGQTVAQTVTSQLTSTQAVAPTIYIPRGYPFVVIVDRDLVLPAPYKPQP